MPGSLPIGIEAAVLIVAIAAGLCDIKMRRIPNWVTVPGAVLGLGLQAYYGGYRGALLSLAGAGIGFGFFLMLHMAGGMGAGDVKLAGAVGALVGAQAFVFVFVAAGLLGGIAALALAVARGRLPETLARTGVLLANFGHLRFDPVRQTSPLHEPGALRLPYGAVIAAGTLVFLALVH